MICGVSGIGDCFKLGAGCLWSLSVYCSLYILIHCEGAGHGRIGVVAAGGSGRRRWMAADDTTLRRYWRISCFYCILPIGRRAISDLVVLARVHSNSTLSSSHKVLAVHVRSQSTGCRTTSSASGAPSSWNITASCFSKLPSEL